MESTVQKLTRNLREGTFFKNVPVTLRNRVVKKLKFSNLLGFINKECKLTKAYQKELPIITSHHYQVGNYYLDGRIPLNDQSIVYSLGILLDIAFDTTIQKMHGCPVYMYDPTPISIDFMSQYTEDPLFQFHPYGVWTEDTTLRFYEPQVGGSSSMMQETSGKYFDAACLSMNTIMDRNKHDHIDVWKADIEGAALPVLLQMVEQGIFPDQIVGEFERPRNDMAKVNSFFDDLTKLRSILKENGYSEYLIPRTIAKYFSLEILFSKNSKMTK